MLGAVLLTVVLSTIPVSGTTPQGTWDVVVADAEDRTATLRAALTIN